MATTRQHGLEAVKIRPMTLEEADTTARLTEEAFNSFNKLVGLPPEFPNGAPVQSFRHHCTDNGVHILVATNTQSGGVIVGTVTIDMRGTVAAIGPIAVAPEWGNKRLGRMLLQAALDIADDDNDKKTCVMLQQVAHNTKSYSLYASLGFVPLENCLHLVGHVKPDLSMPAGYILRHLDAQRDVQQCSAFFTRALPGYDRMEEIQTYVAHGTHAGAKRTCVGLWRHGFTAHDACASPDAHDGGGGDSDVGGGNSSEARLVAYTTGMGVWGHVVAEDRQAFKALIIGLSRSLQEVEGPCMSFFVMARLYPDLIPWIFNESGLRLLRQTSLMARGGPAPIIRETDMVYCPSINY